jgi:hypothetical protein
MTSSVMVKFNLPCGKVWDANDDSGGEQHRLLTTSFFYVAFTVENNSSREYQL